MEMLRTNGVHSNVYGYEAASYLVNLKQSLKFDVSTLVIRLTLTPFCSQPHTTTAHSLTHQFPASINGIKYQGYTTMGIKHLFHCLSGTIFIVTHTLTTHTNIEVSHLFVSATRVQKRIRC